MGSNIVSDGHRHKPKGDYRYNFHPFHIGLGLAAFKDTMAETKFLILLLNIIGFPVFGFALLYVGADFKGWSLWVLALIFAIYKLIHAHLDVVKKNQENKIRELELKEKEDNIYRRKD